MSLIQRVAAEYEKGGLSTLFSSAINFTGKKIFTPKPRYRISNAYWNLKRLNDTSVRAVDGDWDNLIILDACRYDAFSEVNWLEGNLEQRYAVASNTTNFLMKNFVDERLYDTIQLTANPKGIKLENEYSNGSRIFYKTISMMDQWDRETQTVLPEDMVEKAIEVHEKYPHKRLVVHFVQPHLPYIGEKAAEMRNQLGRPPGGYNPNQEHLDVQKENVKRIDFDTVHRNDIDITTADLREAYYESLELALSEIENLLEALNGRSVITADHGEVFNEQPLPFGKGLYGHPKKIKTDSLRQVPWFVVDSGVRRETVAEVPTENIAENNETIENRLRALGYK